MWISDGPVNIYTHYINLITAVDLEGREDYDSKTICFHTAIPNMFCYLFIESLRGSLACICGHRRNNPLRTSLQVDLQIFILNTSLQACHIKYKGGQVCCKCPYLMSQKKEIEKIFYK